jgi:hypothetical protein
VNMPTDIADTAQPLPNPYIPGSEENLGSIEKLSKILHSRESTRIYWGRLSWWGPMRILRQSFGILIFLAAFVGIVAPILAPTSLWQVLALWLPLLFLALGPSLMGAEAAMFSAEARFELSARQGNDHRATPGSDRIIESLRDSRRNGWLQITLGLFAIGMMAFSSFNEKASISWNMALLIAMVIGLGMSVHTRMTMDDVLNHADALPFLALYAPTHHPTGITPALSSLIRAHLDPVLAGEWDTWSRRVCEAANPEMSKDEVLERLILLLYLQESGALPEEKMQSELGEFLDQTCLNDLRQHHLFNRGTLLRMIAHAKAWQPGLFRVLARLQGDLLDHAQVIADEGWRLDVEFENVCFDGQGHLFIALNNQRPQPQRVSIEVHVPGGQPENQTFRLEAPPCAAPSSTLALFSTTRDDVVSWLPRYLCRGVYLWLGVAWEPNESGLRTVQVTLRSEDGDLITSRMIHSKVHRRLGSGDRRRRRRLRRARKLGLADGSNN